MSNSEKSNEITILAKSGKLQALAQFIAESSSDFLDLKNNIFDALIAVRHNEISVQHNKTGG